MTTPIRFSLARPPEVGDRVLMKGGVLEGFYGTVFELHLASGVAGLFPVEIIGRQSAPIEVAFSDLELAPPHLPDYWDELESEREKDL